MTDRADAALVEAAVERLAAAPPAIQRHSLRMTTLALGLARAEGWSVDVAGMACACAFHDLGLSAPGAAPFPARSADLLAGFFDQRGVDEARVEPWVAAVRGHLALHGPVDETHEGALLRRAAWLDAVGLGDARARALRRVYGRRGWDLALIIPLFAGCTRDVFLTRRGRHGSPSWLVPG